MSLEAADRRCVLCGSAEHRSIEHERVTEVARIAWWLRAGLDGPAMPSPELRAELERLADKLESGQRPWSEAPTERYHRG